MGDCASSKPDNNLQALKGDALWPKLEYNGAFIPDTLKKILEVNKYDNVRARANFQPEDGDKIVAFMRDTLHLLINQAQREFYYDIFQFKPDKFVLVPGHQLALKSVVRISKYLVNQSNVPVTNTATSTRRKSGNSTKTTNEVPPTTDEDIINAKCKLDTNIKNYLQGKFVEFKSSFTLETKVLPGGNGSFTAEVKCPATDCSKKFQVGRIQTRWNPSNVYSHVRRVHYPIKKGDKNEKNTMDHYLQSSEKRDGNSIEENSDDECVSPKKSRRKQCINSDDETENPSPDDDLIPIEEGTSEAAGKSSGEVEKEKNNNQVF